MSHELSHEESVASNAIRRSVAAMFAGHAYEDVKNAIHLASSEFAAACKAGGIRRVFAQEYSSGYALYVQIEQSPSIHVLSTPNNLVRNWASLNSLVQFLHRHAMPLSEVVIRLHTHSPQESSSHVS